MSSTININININTYIYIIYIWYRNELSNDIENIYLYDAKYKGQPEIKEVLPLTWRKLVINIKEEPNREEIEQGIYNEWENIIEDDKKFEKFRELLLAASILMPPLYIGKTTNLYARCQNHLSGGDADKNNFKKRFENYAEEMKIGDKLVQNLIFACIYIDDNLGDEAHSLLEGILKISAKPPYGIR